VLLSRIQSLVMRVPRVAGVTVVVACAAGFAGLPRSWGAPPPSVAPTRPELSTAPAVPPVYACASFTGTPVERDVSRRASESRMPRAGPSVAATRSTRSRETSAVRQSASAVSFATAAVRSAVESGAYARRTPPMRDWRDAAVIVTPGNAPLYGNAAVVLAPNVTSVRPAAAGTQAVPFHISSFSECQPVAPAVASYTSTSPTWSNTRYGSQAAEPAVAPEVIWPIDVRSKESQ
jgi:hypothetical protein